MKILLTPWFWIILAVIILLIYLSLGRLAYIDIKGVIIGYWKVFTKKMDLLFFLFFPLLLSLSSTIYNTINEEIANLMAVVLSILTAMILTFMAMTNDKYESSLEKTDKDINHKRLEYRNKDSLAIGIYEILLSIIILILIFMLPVITKNDIALWIISLLIYYGFYSFLLNIFIMVHKLFQVYFH